MFPDTGLGRLEKRIFGNGVLPEDCSDQVLPRLALAVVIGLRHEPPISRIEISVLGGFRFHTALRSTTKARLIVRCFFLATRSTSTANCAGRVTLWRTDVVFRVRGLEALFIP